MIEVMRKFLPTRSSNTIRSGSPRARNAGASAVEFALLFPLLISILIAFVDIIFVMHDFSVLTNAAREGA
ncbi:MAG: TadE family protein, partial [Burkholderiaceae bacterium]